MKFWNSADVNCGPLSVCSCLQIPHVANKTSESINCLGWCCAIFHYLDFRPFRICVNDNQEHVPWMVLENQHGAADRGRSHWCVVDDGMCRVCKQSSQLLAVASISLSIPGHHMKLLTTCFILTMRGCPECTSISSCCCTHLGITTRTPMSDILGL